MKNWKLLALDIDGTILHAPNGVSEPTAAAIRRAADNVMVTFCTGRDISETQSLIDQLGLQKHHHVLGAGSFIHYPDGKISSAVVLTEDLVTQARELVREQSLRDFQLTHNGWMPCGERRARFETTPHILSFLSRDIEHARVIHECLAPLKGLVAITHVSDTQFPQMLNVLVSPLDLNKGAALTRLCLELGIATENIIAIGDMPIDIPMFEMAGLSVAMGNASDDVKQHADLIAPTLEEDGVAYIINRYVLGELAES